MKVTNNQLINNYGYTEDILAKKFGFTVTKNNKTSDEYISLEEMPKTINNNQHIYNFNKKNLKLNAPIKHIKNYDTEKQPLLEGDDKLNCMMVTFCLGVPLMSFIIVCMILSATLKPITSGEIYNITNTTR